MASNFECLGLAVDRDGFGDLMGRVMAAAEVVATTDGVRTHVWQDAGGARLIVWTKRNSVLDLLPSFAGTPGAHLSGVSRANDEIVVATVVDAEGDTLTMLAAGLEQKWSLARDGSADGRAAIVAFGADVSVHENEEAFNASDASLLSDTDNNSDSDSDNGGDAGDPPPRFAEQGLPWPPRMAAESFIPYGVFGAPADAEAYARLNGTVLSAERRTTSLTGQEFIAARVRTAGFEVDLCLPAGIALPGGFDVPGPGNVIGGTVFLVASMPDLTQPPGRPAEAKRSWLSWRRK